MLLPEAVDETPEPSLGELTEGVSNSDGANIANDASTDSRLDPPPTPRKTLSKRGLAIVGVVAILALGLAVFLIAGPADDSDGGPTVEEVEESAWSSCFVFQSAGSADVMDTIWQDENDEKITAGQALRRACDVVVDRVDGGWTLKWNPNGDVAGSGFYAVTAFGSSTGCLEELDEEKIGSTRPLDGRVESTSGKSSWTYSADSGLTVVCED